MRIKNVNKPNKFKNLTLNKDYDAVEDGEVFVVTNDAGFRARYAKNYFRVLPEVPATRNLLDELTVVMDDEDLSITLNRTTRNVDIESNRINASCGVIDVTGIAYLKSTVNEMYNAKVATIVGTKVEMFQRIMDTVMEALREDDPGMCYLISDEIRDADTELDEVLDNISEYVETGTNPNSDHEIALWIIK